MSFSMTPGVSPHLGRRSGSSWVNHLRFVGPKQPIPCSMETRWWARNKTPRSLVERPKVEDEDKFLKMLRGQPLGAVLDDVKQVALKLYRGINTPFSMGLEKALLAGDAVTLAGARVDPRDYSDARLYYLDASAGSFLRKFEKLGELCGDSTAELEKRTLDEFFRAEAECKTTNARIEAYTSGRLSPVCSQFDEILCRAREIIRVALGRVPEVEHLKLRFGPGATSCCTGDSVTIADKLSAFPTLTVDSLPFVTAMKNSRVWCNLIRQIYPQCVYNLRLVTDDYGNEVFLGCDIAPLIVRGNRFTCVPKDATIHRGICIEPHTLSALQLAVGSLLTGRLETVGLVKMVQQQVNRGFAYIGSLFETYATVDLKAASDTIAYELVKLLLPWDWFVFLASLRSAETWVDGNWVQLEKFSSMGNGFTFELETLIFYALARAVSDVTTGELEYPVCTYGDDIIIASQSYSKLAEVLDFCGFTVNRTKSFTSGPFRESCGGDFLAGHEVRPYFLKEAPTYASDWFAVCNGISAMRDSFQRMGGDPGRYDPAWFKSNNHVPKGLRLYGPKDHGDAWIASDDASRWTKRHRHGLNYVLGAKSVPRYRRLERYCSETQYAVVLYGGGAERLPLRGEPDCVTVEWYNVLM